jgi:hypothetical protein
MAKVARLDATVASFHFANFQCLLVHSRVFASGQLSFCWFKRDALMMMSECSRSGGKIVIEFESCRASPFTRQTSPPRLRYFHRSDENLDRNSTSSVDFIITLPSPPPSSTRCVSRNTKSPQNPQCLADKSDVRDIYNNINI